MTVTSRKRFIIVVYFKRAPTQVSEVSQPRTTLYVVKKLMDDGDSVNRRADSGQKTVVDRDSLWVAIRRTASIVGCRSRDSLRNVILGTTAFRPTTPSPSSMRF